MMSLNLLITWHLVFTYDMNGVVKFVTDFKIKPEDVDSEHWQPLYLQQLWRKIRVVKKLLWCKKMKAQKCPIQLPFILSMAK